MLVPLHSIVFVLGVVLVLDFKFILRNSFQSIPLIFEYEYEYEDEDENRLVTAN